MLSPEQASDGVCFSALKALPQGLMPILHEHLIGIFPSAIIGCCWLLLLLLLGIARATVAIQKVHISCGCRVFQGACLCSCWGRPAHLPAPVPAKPPRQLIRQRLHGMHTTRGHL